MKRDTGNNTPRKKYVMALRMSVKASSDDVVVNIVRLERSNVVFKNVDPLDVGALTSPTTLYQTEHRTDVVVFCTYRGDNLYKGKKQHNTEFELVM
ncbi:hypothetical protein JKF63_04652 [Porcisia hertigi]|uniref:Uncharacterized protein n=1 Tax=Porcisia hertigi TaxID=2761500 RepID=A0A836LAG1_9TRYP|nr:hypothetical protein JKF63_04652 [Porcisia hertigi]